MKWLCLLVGHHWFVDRVQLRGYGWFVTEKCDRCGEYRYRSEPVPHG